MPKCKSVVLEEPHCFEINEFSVPEVGPDDLLLKVELVAICGSDPKIFKGQITWTRYPIILGHEVVGRVAGAGVRALERYGVKLGSRVSVEPYVICEKCRNCLTGNYSLCETKRAYGTNLSCADPPHLFGAYGEYMFVLPGSKIHLVDESVPAEAACLSSVIGNGFRWVRTKARVQPFETVVIVGAGAQGLASLIAAKECGAGQVIMLGRSCDEMRFTLARELGADHTIDIDRSDALSAVKSLTGGQMADVVIEASGSPNAIQSTLDLARPLGRIVFAGVTGFAEVALTTDKIVNNELQVFGGLGQSWDVEAAMFLINRQKYPIHKLVTHRFPMSKVREAFDLVMNLPEQCVRVALEPLL